MRGIVSTVAVVVVLAIPTSSGESIYVNGAATPEEAYAARAFAERYTRRAYRTPAYLYVREPLVDDASLAPLAHLTKVERLELVGLPISDEALIFLAPLIKLRSLQIVGNRPHHGEYELESEEIYSTITGAGFKHLTNLDKLRELQLWRLRLEPGVLSELRELDSLEWLTIHGLESAVESSSEGAGITDQTLADLRDLRHLKYVSLGASGTNLSGSGLSDWMSATCIENLSLGGFYLREPGWAALAKFTNLHSFRYIPNRGSSNRRPVIMDADTIDWKVLGSLAKLEQLYVRGITNRAVEGIAECKQLRTLQLGGEGFSDDGLNRISGLSELVELNLENTEVTGSGFTNPDCFPSLKVVKLKESKVDDAGLARICKLPALERLDVESTNVTPEGLKAIVNCKVTLKYLRPPLPIWEYWTPEHKAWVTAVDKLKAEMPDLEVDFTGDAPP